ncbi:MAG: DUF190 domain-containing protein [Methanosarcinaceae archaeon]|nr:DUF190 domain-containing protein [Methanosarcinaceae archaeon]MDF1533077.1 DUF190 domain-containing protein [Methanosarcinaceae archaeon]
MKAVLLRIYLSENDTYKGRSAHHVIIEYLKDSFVAGATVIHGIEGYGVHSNIHTASILRLGVDLPLIVEAVDTDEKIRPLLPKLREIAPRELMTLQEVEIISGENL